MLVIFGNLGLGLGLRLICISKRNMGAGLSLAIPMFPTEFIVLGRSITF